MKKILCVILSLAMCVCVITSCGKPPAPLKEGGSDEVLTYLADSAAADYQLTESAEINLTDSAISSERTVLLPKGVTLKFTGTINSGSGCITVRAASEREEMPVLDLSGLVLTPDIAPDITLFEMRKDVELILPEDSSCLRINKGNEWTSIMTAPSQPSETDETSADVTNEDIIENFEASNAEEFLAGISNPKAYSIDLMKDISVNFDGKEISRDIIINCNNYSLAMTGKLTMNGGKLEIGDNSDNDSAKVDLTKLSITCNCDAYNAQSGDIFYIGLNFKQIIGEPTLDENLVYEIPDSGVQAGVKLKEITTPEMHETKLQEDMTAYLMGEDIPGGVFVGKDFLADGVLEINLDNPTIDHNIGVMMDGGTTIIITGEVTFDGGYYGFKRTKGDTEGTVTVDITGLKINGTKALGHTKSPDIFKMTGKDIVLLFNESDPQVKVEQNEYFWLRFVQPEE